LESGTMNTIVNTILADRVLCDLIDQIEHTLIELDDGYPDGAADTLGEVVNYLLDLREQRRTTTAQSAQS
jgi:hypothetical protein